MDHLLVKNISHYLFVSWKNTLWNQARNQAETRSKKMTPAVLLKDKYKMNLKPRVDLASLKIYGCLHEGSWKFPCKGITREKTSKASDLPIWSPYCFLKGYHKCWISVMSLNNLHLSSKIPKENPSCTSFPNTNRHAILNWSWKTNGSWTLTGLGLVKWTPAKGLRWIPEAAAVLHFEEIMWIHGRAEPKLQTGMKGQHSESVWGWA